MTDNTEDRKELIIAAANSFSLEESEEGFNYLLDRLRNDPDPELRWLAVRCIDSLLGINNDNKFNRD
jgi:hypothetical protein